MPTRRRLTPSDRRRQLVDVGATLFATRPYESVLMEEVAERAGVSRALLYKHFPSKRDLFAAIYREAADGLLDATELDTDVAFVDQVAAGLDTHIEYFAANSSAVLAANRTLAGDATIQAIITGELAVLRQRMIDVSGLDGSARDILASVLTGWLVFVRVLVLDWLATPTFSRAELHTICMGALTGALGDLVPRIERARLHRVTGSAARGPDQPAPSADDDRGGDERRADRGAGRGTGPADDLPSTVDGGK